MTVYEFKLPDVGEGITEAEIVAWHAKPGDWLDEDAPLADVMTDKATIEMTTPVAGRLVRTGAEIGDMLAIGAVLAAFEVDGNTVAADVPAPASVPEPATSEIVAAPVVAAPAPQEPSAVIPERVATPSSGHTHARVKASPAVRVRAKDLGVNLADVRPSDGSRVRHSDLDAYLSYNAGGGYAPAGRSRPDEEIRVIGMRRKIAENMAASKRNIPHFSYIEEVNVTKFEDLRVDLNATRGDKPKLTMLPLLITAICKTLPDYPMMNARYDDEAGIVRRSGAVHLGMATQTDAGLMVPVIRNAELRNVWQLATEIGRLADAARRRQATPDELTGSTITVTSLGALGGVATTPVINRPEVAIIGPNKIVERPIVRNGAIVIAQMMNLSISCDHRVVDGWDAANFAQSLKRLIETPALLFAP